MNPERELNAYLACGEHGRPTFTDRQVEAAARAMYEMRPKHTDPVRWETPWEDVPEEWKQGQRIAARAVLEAALGGDN